MLFGVAYLPRVYIYSGDFENDKQNNNFRVHDVLRVIYIKTLPTIMNSKQSRDTQNMHSGDSQTEKIKSTYDKTFEEVFTKPRE